MLKEALILMFVGVVANQVVVSTVDVSDILDDAKAKVEELREIVLGAILVAEDKLENFNLDLQLRSQDIENNALLSIETEKSSINEKVITLKDLASSAHVNISYCLQGREDYLSKLPDAISDELTHCISGKVQEGKTAVSSYKYLIDITINKVDALEFELNLCRPDSEICISPILEQILLETEQLPQGIQVQVEEVEELFTSFKVLVSNCADLKVSQYVSSASTILRDITNCVDNLLG